MHRQMSDMMKAMGKNKGAFARMLGGGRGRMPEPTPEMIEQLQKGMPGVTSEEVPRLPGLGGGTPPGGSGAPKFPGLPGLPGAGKKK
jgi:signal recognition particle subunit SRP54